MKPFISSGVRVRWANASASVSHPNAGQSLACSRQPACPRPRSAHTHPHCSGSWCTSSFQTRVSIQRGEGAPAHRTGSPRGGEQRTPRTPCLRFHNPAPSHDTIVVPHSLNLASTKLSSFLLLLNPPRRKQGFVGERRGERFQGETARPP